ncbi:MAG: beta-galactosidase/beta-glucuronidase [Candidatus Azotimanducaceae bacterium]
MTTPRQPRPTPRQEYPRPTIVREQWLNLNGEWRFQPDLADSGLMNRWYEDPQFDHTIVVPFPIESEASEIHDLTPSPINWYARAFELPAEWQAECVRLNIGACDHWTRVFINKLEVGQHRGGYSPISLDISHALKTGANQLVIRVEDSMSWTQPRGKQAGTTKWPIDYDTVTGIWQTVWLEPISKLHINALHSQFNLDRSELTCWIETSHQNRKELLVELICDGQVLISTTANFNDRAEARAKLIIPNPELWSPESPFLYDLRIRLLDQEIKDDENCLDEIKSYVGLREIGTDKESITLNGKPIYIRGVLDQGYFEKGWYTAVDDQMLKRDVELTLALGFNCARKHQKIEDPRYLYWADQLGLLVWEEMPSGRVFSNELVRTLSNEWADIIKRDRQHPCIIAWVPFNESWGIWNQIDRPEQRAFVDGIVGITRAFDQSRLVVGNDGWEYSSGDLWTLHLYEGESSTLAERLDSLMTNPSAAINGDDSAVGKKVGALLNANVEGLPIILTECGGIGFVPGHLKGDEFAYGELPQNANELAKRFRTVADTIDKAKKLKGFVWTQFTDVQQEINGVLYFDRTPKFPLDEIRKIITSIGDH